MSTSATAPSLRRVDAQLPAARLGTRFAKHWAWWRDRRALVRAARLARRARKLASAWPRPLRLCLGSGAAPITGWRNLDIDERADLCVDLRAPLPFEDASAELIYSEHLLEHFDLEIGLALLRECRRVLREDGVLRIAMPDLTTILAAYEGDWRAQDWLSWPGYQHIRTRVHMLNTAFHAWGHRYLYDFEEVLLRLRAAGFGQVWRCEVGESSTPALCNLETRADSRLIVEARGCRWETA